MNAICLVIDRLHAGYLGAYGNSWIDTPSFDRLAVESFVADQFLIDSPKLESLYRAYWHGRHALDAGTPDPQSALPALVQAAGVRPTLLTDEPAVARHSAAKAFSDVIEFARPEPAAVAEDYDQTHLAGSFARAIQWLDAAREPFLLWCHFAGLSGPWDAPLEFRQRYVEADDPEPPAGSQPPCRMLAEDYDPDELLGACQTYAGQVTLLDTCLGAMLEFLDSHPAGRETLFVLTSARGFPLGEHRRLGPVDDALYGELVHVPLVMRLPDGQGAAVRTQSLAHPADLWSTLLDFCQAPDVPPAPVAASLMPLVHDETASFRNRLVLTDGPRRAIRTPAWYLRDADQPELFAKPDDRWEANDVANRCGDVVELLQDAMRQHEADLRTGQPAEPFPLDDVLLNGVE